MKRECLSWAWVLVLVGCGGPPTEDLVVRSSAASTATVVNGVRGYTRADGRHAVLHAAPLPSRVIEHLENPFPVSAGVPLANAFTSGPLWGYLRSDGVNIVLYSGSGHLHELAQNANGDWGDADFTASGLINAPSVRTEVGLNPQIFAYIRTDSRNAIVYPGTNGHVYEVASNFPNSPPWVTADLTSFTGGTGVAIDGVVPYIRSDGRNALVYSGTDGHPHEIASNFPNSPAWIDTDLTTASGAPLTAGSVWGYQRSDGVNAVVYFASDGLLHELSLKIGSPCGQNQWCDKVIATTSHPTFAGMLTAYVRADGRNAIVYVASDRHMIREVLMGAGESWSDHGIISTNLTILNVFAQRAPGNRSAVMYTGQIGDNVNGYELSLPNGGTWQPEQF